jgi:hypothetical protein
MKKTIKQLLALTLALLCLICMFSCGSSSNDNKEQPSTDGNIGASDGSISKTGVWENALYLEDTTFGEGANTITVKVKADGQSVTFTIKTDKKTVGEALMEHDLLAGEEGAYGLYVKKVNGITADYDKDQTYWALYIDGEYAMSGVDTTDVSEGTVYTLERTK